MNWEAAGAIGEIISAVGVIGTLVYLAIQIRENTHESRIASTSNLSDQYTSFLRHITGNPELSSLWTRAVDGDPEELAPEERARAIMAMGIITRILENAYLHHRAGRMDDASWEGYEKILHRGAYSKLFSVYWGIRRDMHNDDFARLVDRVSADPDKQKMFN